MRAPLWPLFRILTTADWPQRLCWRLTCNLPAWPLPASRRTCKLLFYTRTLFRTPLTKEAARSSDPPPVAGGVEVAERCAYYGIASNLITYLTGPLGQSTAVAAQNVNVWSGLAWLLPLLGALVADSFPGRYRTIVLASFIYILGLGLLTLSAMLPSLSSPDCQDTNLIMSCSPISLQAVLFFFSLYLVAIAQGAHKPCAQAFGADQFDGQDLEESKAKASFFNWWYFSTSGGASVALLVLSYIQDNLNWVLGFGIPCIMMVVALVIFLLGTKT